MTQVASQNAVEKLIRRVVSGVGRRLVVWASPTPPTPPSQPIPNLAGDRDLEWTYVASRIGRYGNDRSCVLDFGCGMGLLSFVAASLGARVVAIDLMPQRFDVAYPNVEFREANVMALDENERFDLILNCSTIEHVGLSGRYNSIEASDGDMEAMQKLKRMLAPVGHMLITLPIGKDAVIRPLHRIYGRDRLPKLLNGYEVVESSFFRKDQRNIWIPCKQHEAFAEEGNDHYYALGCMVLRATE